MDLQQEKVIKIQYKLFFLLGISVVSILLSVSIANYIGEQYFFDKLFYKKSTTFGYTADEGHVLTEQNDARIEFRIKDLRDLLANRNSNVLGVKSNNTYNIAVIGDSYVYGTGVKANLRFGNILEEKLNKIRPTKVYNLGISGDNIFDNFAKYQMVKKYVNPDLYIFGMVDNDLFIEDHNKYNNEETYIRIKQLCSEKPEFYINEWWKYGIRVRAEIFYPPYLPEYSNTCYASQLLSELDKTDKMLWISFGYVRNKLPEKSEYLNKDGTMREDNFRDDFMHYTYKELVENAGLSVVTTDMEGNPNNFIFKPVSEREAHPSAETHAEYARILFEKIVEDRSLNFTSKE